MSATDDLIGTLSTQAGSEAGRSAASFRRAFLFSTLISLIVAVALSATGLGGFRDTLPNLFRLEPFQLKIAGAVLLALGAFLLARRAAIPGRGSLSLLLLLPGAAAFVLQIIIDPWGPPRGEGGDTLNCAIDIALLSLPALWLILRVLKSAAPTRPGWTGALAGLLAGAMGAAGHAFACYNDGGVSVGIWYGAALLFTTTLGAVIGRRTLRW